MIKNNLHCPFSSCDKISNTKSELTRHINTTHLQFKMSDFVQGDCRLLPSIGKELEAYAHKYSSHEEYKNPVYVDYHVERITEIQKSHIATVLQNEYGKTDPHKSKSFNIGYDSAIAAIASKLGIELTQSSDEPKTPKPYISEDWNKRRIINGKINLDSISHSNVPICNLLHCCHGQLLMGHPEITVSNND